MNKKIGMYSSLINCFAVLLFAISMIISSTFLGYISSMFIAFSFVPMICSFCVLSKKENKAAGYSAIVFAGIYATIIILVYFAQLTSVRLDGLGAEALKIIDYTKSGLYFNYDLLGYGMMALSTFFAGLSFKAISKADKWLKALLLIHGVFFLSCFIMPLFGLFSSNTESGTLVGIIALEFWCVYFIPIGILSFFHFKKCELQ